MKKLVMILLCICTASLLTGCVTLSLWDHGIVHKISERKIILDGNDVHFQSKETIQYPFTPFHWMSEQTHDRVFTARSGAISEWTIEPDSKAPRFSGKFGLPLYCLPEKSILPRPGEVMPDTTFWKPQTHLKIHPDDIPLLQKPFLFQGRSINGKWITTLQIPVGFHDGKLTCCMPEGSEIVTQENYFWERPHGLSFAWCWLWTPCTVVCDIVCSPFVLCTYAIQSWIPIMKRENEEKYFLKD